jgi:hypothetical protein
MVDPTWSIRDRRPVFSEREKLRLVSENLIERFGSLFGGAAGLRNFPFHLTRADFILRDATGLAGIGLYHRRRSRLQLACTAGGDQDITIVAVEAFDQFHEILSLATGTQDFDCRKFSAAFFASEADNTSYFPTKCKTALAVNS